MKSKFVIAAYSKPEDAPRAVAGVMLSGHSGQGGARVSAEQAERRDGGAFEGHAAPADRPAAERHYESGEDAGEHRSCECCAGDEHGRANVDGGGREKSNRGAGGVRGGDAASCPSRASEQPRRRIDSAGAGECSAVCAGVHDGACQFGAAMGPARESMVFDRSVRRAARATAGADGGDFGSFRSCILTRRHIRVKLKTLTGTGHAHYGSFMHVFAFVCTHGHATADPRADRTKTKY